MGDFLKPKGLTAEQLQKARTEDFRFHNPPAYELFGAIHKRNVPHGEFESMERATGKMPAKERRVLDRDRMSHGLAEVTLSEKGRPF